MDLRGDPLALHLRALVERFPAVLRPALLRQLPRARFEAGVVGPPRGAGTLVDLGAGLSLLPLACARLGWRVTAVDDQHLDHAGYDFGLHREAGVTVERADLLAWRPAAATGAAASAASFEAAVCIDVLEHLHHSPRPLFTAVARALAPGGLLLLGAPNAANLRKRLALPLGLSTWSRFDDWWQPETFRGHVREPTLGELRRMVRALGLREEAVFGRSFQGHYRGGLAALAARALELPLRALPQLASDLYLRARKPGASSS